MYVADNVRDKKTIFSKDDEGGWPKLSLDSLQLDDIPEFSS